MADVSLPFGGVPFGVKELERVKDWPFTDASMIFKDRISRSRPHVGNSAPGDGCGAGATDHGQRVRRHQLHLDRIAGTTRNPWNLERTPGGSSGGSATAVAGGLLPIATGSDGGGSIRIPAGFTGLFGLKATYGPIPKGPRAAMSPLTTVLGCLTRSVRDTARYVDVCNGFDQRVPLSLPQVGGWEAALGSHDLAGLTVAIVPDLGIARVRSEVADLVIAASEQLAGAAGLRMVSVTPTLPPLRGQWAMAGQVFRGQPGERLSRSGRRTLP
jgi:Asp-tRNA(Asn)/Glu-tRNA(Gln) amidotransferase A subunit family amidase